MLRITRWGWAIAALGMLALLLGVGIPTAQAQELNRCDGRSVTHRSALAPESEGDRSLGIP